MKKRPTANAKITIYHSDVGTTVCYDTVKGQATPKSTCQKHSITRLNALRFYHFVSG